MKPQCVSRFLAVSLSVWLVFGVCPVCFGQGLTLSLPRHAYLRGESIPLTVSAPQQVKDGTVEVFLDGNRVTRADFQGSRAKVSAPTAETKVGKYTLKAVVRSPAGEVSGSCEVTVARRSAADRLEVWLWSLGDGDFGYYFDHGFTIAGGPSWVYWRDSARAINHLDARLARGVFANIGPCGGISRRELKGVDPNADGVAYLGAGRHAETFYNPFSPVVGKVRSEANRKFMDALGDHPAVKVAFYNTELVDNLWLDNLNREGLELSRKNLGFTREQIGKPKFVAPGVIADDDRGYRFIKFVYRKGNGLPYANQQTAEDVRRHRPDVWTLTDPYRQVALSDMFPGLDLVGTWTYTNNDPKLMLYVETMRALTRRTKQMPLQTVTLLNYPGALAPRSVTGPSGAKRGAPDFSREQGWMLMGPERCKEVSWIILSRAAKIIGYYYSSVCNPLKYSRPDDQFRVPHATSDAIQELSERVYMPYGPMITRLDTAKRRIAVLSSQASRLYGKSPRTIGYPNEQIYGFYSVLAMAHLDGDVLFDEHVARGDLKDYDVLVLPKCDVVTKTMHDEILKFAGRGGVLIADQYLGPEFPGVLRFDFDFTYRTKVNADAIASGVTYAEWDDHLNPKTAALANARGVTAEEDQKIMESYARRLKAGLAGKVQPEVDVDTPKALVNVLEKEGTKYLVLVNDCRAYDDRTGKYKAIMEKLLPQTVTVTLNRWSGPLYAYDLLERKPLVATPLANGCRFQVELTELGGKIIALYAARPAKPAISVPGAAKRGAKDTIEVIVQDDHGQPLPGLQPLRVTVTDPQGDVTEYSGYYCASRGKLSIGLTPALNDRAGPWKVAVEDLTTGLTAQEAFDLR